MDDWNINKYRRPHDTDDEWIVMSEFMNAHKSHIPEARLVCLANVLKNILFYKCRYPIAVMQQIDFLAKDIKDRVLARRKGLLTRHFVAASDASKQSIEAKSAINAHKLEEAKVKKSNLIKGYNFVKSTNKDEEEDNQTAGPSQNTGSGEKVKPGSEEAEEGEPKTESTSGETQIAKTEKSAQKKLEEAALKKSNLIKSFNFVKSTNLDEEEENQMEDPSQNAGSGFKRKTPEEGESPPKNLKTPQGTFKPVAFQSSGMQEVVSQTEPDQEIAEQGPAHPVGLGFEFPAEKAEAIYKHLGDIVLYRRQRYVPTQSLSWTCDRNNIHSEFILTESECRLRLKNMEIVCLQREGRSKAGIKTALADRALQILRRKYYTINVKPFDAFTHTISKKDVATATDPNTIPESSIGFKLLKMMGWSGGGLGKDNSGITEPVRPIRIIGRSGFGTKNSIIKLESYVKQVVNKLATGQADEDFAFSPEFTKEERSRIHRFKKIIPKCESETESQKMEFESFLTELINKLACGAVEEDHAFSPEFTNVERARIHALAQARKIKSKSYGKGEERFLVLSPRFTPQQLREKLLRTGEDNRYSLIPPEK